MFMKAKVVSGGKERGGRGFSYLELKKAEMDVRKAKQLGIRIDPRRKTAHEKNIKSLKIQMALEKKKREKGTKKKVSKERGKRP
jgi:ribosomal protein L13E